MQRDRDSDQRRDCRCSECQQQAAGERWPERGQCKRAPKGLRAFAQCVEGHYRHWQREKNGEHAGGRCGEQQLCSKTHGARGGGEFYLASVAATQPLSISPFFAAAARTSSGRTCGAEGSLSATVSGSLTPGTDGRTNP